MKKGKSTEIAKFNSATIPPINKETLAKHLTIGYHANPRTGNFDVSKASIKIKREFLTFLDCIGHIEISATAKAREPKSRKTSPASPAPVSGAGPLYGAGRGAGQRGGNTAQWRHMAADGGQHTPAGATITSTVTRTPETWSYPITTTTVTASSSSTSPAAAASVFTDTFLRMKKPVSSQKPAVVRVSPPFSSAETVELVLGVAPCQEYSLQLRILSPAGAVVAAVADLALPRLPDIPSYVPPPVSEVVEVKFLLGGKHDLAAKQGGPIPDSCLLDYFEAVDAFSSRVEGVATSLAEANTAARAEQTAVQRRVEVTQEAVLRRHGCLCPAPRLLLDPSPAPAPAPAPAWAGVYLCQGMHGGRPSYRQD